MIAAALAGCSARDMGSMSANQSPATTESTAALPLPRARSPVPAFHGGGDGWRFDIQADTAVRHTAKLLYAGASTNATLVLRQATPAADPHAFEFEGTLFTARGDTPLRVHIRREDCKDAAGILRMQTVEVAVQGVVRLRGCGEITPY
jgi:hypothetical protein